MVHHCPSLYQATEILIKLTRSRKQGLIYASLTHEVGREQETKEWRGRVEREAGGAGFNCPVLDVDIIVYKN